METGDRVIVCWKKEPNTCESSWIDIMDGMIGKTGEIKTMYSGDAGVYMGLNSTYRYHQASLVKVNRAGLPMGMLPVKKGAPCVICGKLVPNQEYGFCGEHLGLQVQATRKQLACKTGFLIEHFTAEKIREVYNAVGVPKYASSAPTSTPMPPSEAQQEKMVHTQNRSLTHCSNWVELVLPDGRIVSPSIPSVEDGWKETHSYSWPEKYEARACVCDSGEFISVRLAKAPEGSPLEAFHMDPIFMHDMAPIIRNEAVFVRAAKRLVKVEIQEETPEPYLYFCPSKNKLKGTWPKKYASGAVERRK